MDADIRMRNEKVHPVDADTDKQREGAPVDAVTDD